MTVLCGVGQAWATFKYPRDGSNFLIMAAGHVITYQVSLHQKFKKLKTWIEASVVLKNCKTSSGPHYKRRGCRWFTMLRAGYLQMVNHCYALCLWWFFYVQFYYHTFLSLFIYRFSKRRLYCTSGLTSFSINHSTTLSCLHRWSGSPLYFNL
jgi:hypothetical protein